MHKARVRKYMSSALSFPLMILILIPCLVHSQTESEPNDQLEQANEIRLGETVEGFFQEKNDNDWYKLVIDKSGKNIIRIDLSGVPDVDVTKGHTLSTYTEERPMTKTHTHSAPN